MTVNHADIYTDILKCHKCVAVSSDQRCNYCQTQVFSSASTHLNTNPNPTVCVCMMCVPPSVFLFLCHGLLWVSILPSVRRPISPQLIIPLSCALSPFHVVDHFPLSASPFFFSCMHYPVFLCLYLIGTAKRGRHAAVDTQPQYMGRALYQVSCWGAPVSTILY